MSEPLVREFPLIKRTRVANEAMDVIKTMIINGELTPGHRLPAERDLAFQLGLSRPSLREAIRALIALNILESRHGEGTFVSSLEPELLAEPIDFLLSVSHESIFALFEARRALEAALVALAAERADEAELTGLEELVEHGAERIDDVEAFIQHDLEFHRQVSVAAHSPILASLLSSVSTLSMASRRRTAQSRRIREQAM